MSGTSKAQVISIVDDDTSVREALKDCVESAGYEGEAFASAEDFWASAHRHSTACLILDVRLPGMDGFDLYRQLLAVKSGIPVIFITAHGDESMRTRALKDGAVDFLQKPVSREALLNAVHSALGASRERAGEE
jgi:FixJ family two-component response regulator